MVSTSEHAIYGYVPLSIRQTLVKDDASAGIKTQSFVKLLD